MRCQNCQAELAPDASFCPSCGAFVQQATVTPPRFEYVQTSGAKAGVPGVPEIPMAQPAWVTIVICALAGVLVGHLGYLRLILDYMYGIYVYFYIWLPIALVVLAGTLMLLIPLSKRAGMRGRLIIGLGLAALGLIIQFLAYSTILLAAGVLLVLVGIAFILSTLGKWGASKFWLYPIGGLVGALIFYAIRFPVLDNFGAHMIPVFILILVLVLGVVAAIFTKPEPVTGRSYSAGQMASIIGTFVVLLGLLSWL